MHYLDHYSPELKDLLNLENHGILLLLLINVTNILLSFFSFLFSSVLGIVKRYARVLIAERNFDRAVPLLRIAIEKVQTQRNLILTSLHAPFALACLKTQKYAFAENIVMNLPCEIDNNDKIDSKSVLSYFYYAGVIALALERFGKALELFSACFVIPTAVLSAIHVAAYKKFILTSIIVRGEVGDFPRGSSPSLSRHLPAVCPAYKQLADAVKEVLGTLIDEHQYTLQEDKNLGLARVALQHVMKRKVKKLTNTFRTLQLDDIAKLSGLDNAVTAEKLLFEMVSRKEIFAVIDKDTGLVKFLDDPEIYASYDFCKSLETKFFEAHALLQEAKKLNIEISLNQQFIEKMARRDGRRGSGEGGMGPMGDANDPELEMALAASMNM
jgi:COP9 signalosome complex subunit 3